MTAYSRNAQSFISRMSETKNEDLITSKDFELFHDLGFKLFDREHLEAINVSPPVCWEQVKQNIRRFGELTPSEIYSWLTDIEIYTGPIRNHYSQLMELDCFLSLCQETSTHYPFHSLFYLKMHFSSLGFSDLLLYDFSHAFTLDENSLKFDNGHSDVYPLEEGFPLLFNAFLQHFSTAQLKVISINNLDSEEVEYSDLANLILSNRLSLRELKINNTQLNDAESVIDIHLPNIEKIKVPFLQGTNFHLILGEKLIWIEPYHDDLSFEFEQTLPSSEPEVVDGKAKLLRFFKNYPNLQGFEAEFSTYLYEPDVLEGFKSLKHLKFFDLFDLGPIQEYIVSENIENLVFGSANSDEIDWDGLASMKKLRSLAFGPFFWPTKEIFEFLRSDHLESLALCLRFFDKNETVLFFEAISQTKKLKTLGLSFDAVVQNPVLSDCVESLELQITRYSNESESEDEKTGSESESVAEETESERGIGIEELESEETERKAKESEEEVGAEEYILEQLSNEFLSFLPFGKGVKHLVLNHSSGFAKNIHQKDLDEHFPNLETIQFR